MKILAIIPAKLDSTRLKNKNIREIKNKPMFLHSVEYAKKSKYDIDIIVSSESNKVREICILNNVDFLERDSTLCGDTEVVDVYISVVNDLTQTYDIVVGLQPDNPNRVNSLDSCIEYMIENKYDDIITIDSTYRRSGAMRLFNYNYLKNEMVSKRIGCIKETATDIHTEEDLSNLTKIF